MKLKTLNDINLTGKTILYRAPYDIDVKEINGALEVADDMRIRATLPTLKYLLKENCKIIILTYVKRPDGKVVENLRTTPHARKLSELLNRPVLKVDDCIGPLVDEKISQMKQGDILMLENVRFYKEETEDDDEFSKKLCLGKDLIVFDGFPQAMRAHASTTGIERHLPAVAGLYLEHEVNMLSDLLESPKRPFTVIIGGAKISDKVDSVNNLLNIADKILVGGAVANVFLKALGKNLGSSFVEDIFVDAKKREKRDWVLYAKEILEKYRDKIVYPEDIVVSDGTETRIVDIFSEKMSDKWSAFDIGPKTRENFSNIIKKSATVFLGGPMGKFEDEKFAEGSRAVLNAMKEVAGTTIIAGGDTIDVARKYASLDDYSHVSLAGGATLEFLAGKELPALQPLLV
ncbi:TPA: phosphoglycerate kinase [Candidatus Nomurabacteria bacterium]|uniref:Phosphoglycerate kinase n=1 Tax=Candidatus Nomurabacteria bacterium RIFOXYA2_FULL_42_12 TaxID=1801801 RepID=A0A1F6YPN0_9BACT|nr:MAG: phosphoglycerate kinase [Parcubacteria group bacterium GW2011_GWC1_42_21]KKS58133.1 MAG: phosphoglycerate kinase [Candidatus Nomurabacteria bacterium GW2011_GWF1_42_40]KKT00507.1 MAG: phosphoglycerate kinase [Candidatus Nomurabacteria bacterium GW2011_GWA1_43_17]KKT07852.1 MAG: phosphoglycerate kinase [Candidatus Nomurabacteria bacterium GW2011_GWB1_43_19]OGJ05146.1 MAG: phosphoglycerate kinase [Candidatus Nomurabacteria bacterium RIFOXYB1_FULL_43_14]OGJ08156.1 MAG: phosphoglycerate ki